MIVRQISRGPPGTVCHPDGCQQGLRGQGPGSGLRDPDPMLWLPYGCREFPGSRDPPLPPLLLATFCSTRREVGSSSHLEHPYFERDMVVPRGLLATKEKRQAKQVMCDRKCVCWEGGEGQGHKSWLRVRGLITGVCDLRASVFPFA